MCKLSPIAEPLTPDSIRRNKLRKTVSLHVEDEDNYGNTDKLFSPFMGVGVVEADLHFYVALIPSLNILNDHIKSY